MTCRLLHRWGPWHPEPMYGFGYLVIECRWCKRCKAFQRRPVL